MIYCPASQLSEKDRKRANSIARKKIPGTICTHVQIQPGEEQLIEHQPACYKRRSDNMPVSRAYYKRAYSQCYYSESKCIVTLNKVDFNE